MAMHQWSQPASAFRLQDSREPQLFTCEHCSARITVAPETSVNERGERIVSYPLPLNGCAAAGALIYKGRA